MLYRILTWRFFSSEMQALEPQNACCCDFMALSQNKLIRNLKGFDFVTLSWQGVRCPCRLVIDVQIERAIKIKVQPIY